MWAWSEILNVAEEMGVELVWAKLSLGSLNDPFYICKGQHVGVLTRQGRPLMNFRCIEGGGLEYAWLDSNEINPFTHRLMLNRLG